MQKENEAHEAISKLNHSKLEGQKIFVSISRNNQARYGSGDDYPPPPHHYPPHPHHAPHYLPPRAPHSDDYPSRGRLPPPPLPPPPTTIVTYLSAMTPYSSNTLPLHVTLSGILMSDGFPHSLSGHSLPTLLPVITGSTAPCCPHLPLPAMHEVVLGEILLVAALCPLLPLCSGFDKDDYFEEKYANGFGRGY
ncbi:unnamed protein product [Coregonus sp. 'balchen']|nr:unnamed protein product [Coregonus sp. 'balchen']